MRTVLLSSLFLTLAAPTVADPTVGIGLSISFGGGAPQTGIAFRVFSDDQEEEFVGSVGLDYMFGSQSLRGTVGAAYLADNSFVGLDLGYGIGSGAFDFGVSAGGTKTSATEPEELQAPIVCISECIDQGS